RSPSGSLAQPLGFPRAGLSGSLTQERQKPHQDEGGKNTQEHLVPRRSLRGRRAARAPGPRSPPRPKAEGPQPALEPSTRANHVPAHAPRGGAAPSAGNARSYPRRPSAVQGLGATDDFHQLGGDRR